MGIEGNLKAQGAVTMTRLLAPGPCRLAAKIDNSDGGSLMSLAESMPQSSLAQEVESYVRQYTHGRIRNLVVVEDQVGRVMVSGEVRTWHAKQLALQGALELLAGDQFRERITVVRSN